MTKHPPSIKQFSYITEMMELALQDSPTLRIRGRVVQVIGTIIKAVVPSVKVGELCILRNPGESFEMKGEVVGFVKDAALITPIGDMFGISSATEVIPTGRAHMVPVGNGLLGRVLDGLGRPLDEAELGPIESNKFYPVFADAPDPLKRRIISQPLELGVRALDGLLTCGEGQRMGIFAAAGGGKSTLMGMLVKGADVDVTVVALIGERGREVREFLEHELGPEGRRKSVIVCATSDKSSMERSKAAYVATAIAEYFRDQGKNVMMMMDSVTRFAMAQREVGLAIGEPPATRGYTPSVFAMLPKLLERTGTSPKGSITALYTVLVDGDDMNEPIADAVRGILDGHIVLSRHLAHAGHYPAVDVLASVSRLVTEITTPDVRAAGNEVRKLMATYKEKADLISIGAYQPGSDPDTDAAIAARQPIDGFLKQLVTEPSSAESADQTLAQLAQLSGTWEAPVVDGFLVDPNASMAAGNGADGGMPLHNAIPPLHISS